MEVVVTTGGVGDLIAIRQHFEETRPEGGAWFDEEVEKAILRLANFPGSGPPFFGMIRRLILTRSKHAVFYSVHGRRLVIGAILSMRLDRKEIFRQLKWRDLMTE